MAQNLYSLTRFSLGSESSAVQLTMNFTATFKGSFGIGANAVVQDVPMQTIFNSKAQGSIGLPLLMDLFGEIESQILGGELIALMFGAFESLQFSAKAGFNMPVVADFSEEMIGGFVLGADVPAKTVLSAGLNNSTSIGANINTDNDMTAILSAMIAAIDIKENVSVVNTRLAPGDELRIDSENFTVTLNGVNILHLQEGDWIRLGRGLLAIGVDSGTAGTLSGSLVCEERWL